MYSMKPNITFINQTLNMSIYEEQVCITEFFKFSGDALLIGIINLIFVIALMFLIDRVSSIGKVGLFAVLKFNEKTDKKLIYGWIIDRTLNILFMVNIVAVIMNVLKLIGIN